VDGSNILLFKILVLININVKVELSCILYESRSEFQTRTEHGIPQPNVRILVREVGIPNKIIFSNANVRTNEYKITPQEYGKELIFLMFNDNLFLINQESMLTNCLLTVCYNSGRYLLLEIMVVSSAYIMTSICKTYHQQSPPT